MVQDKEFWTCNRLGFDWRRLLAAREYDPEELLGLEVERFAVEAAVGAGAAAGGRRVAAVWGCCRCW